MPDAEHFLYHRAFPFCPFPPNEDEFDKVRNLTLAQVMDFFWNTKDIEFSFAGSVSWQPLTDTFTTNATGTIKFNSPATTGDFAALDRAYGWPFAGEIRGIQKGYGLDTDDYQLIADLPNSPAPKERVCAQDATFLSVQLTASSGSLAFPFNVLLYFLMRSDDENAGRFAISYKFLVQAGDYYEGAIPPVIAWTNPTNGALHPPSQSAHLLNSGTFEIGGITFNYECYNNPHAVNYSATGGTMSAARTAFTYPP